MSTLGDREGAPARRRERSTEAPRRKTGKRQGCWGRPTSAAAKMPEHARSTMQPEDSEDRATTASLLPPGYASNPMSGGPRRPPLCALDLPLSRSHRGHNECTLRCQYPLGASQHPQPVVQKIWNRASFEAPSRCPKIDGTSQSWLVVSSPPNRLDRDGSILKPRHGRGMTRPISGRTLAEADAATRGTMETPDERRQGKQEVCAGRPEVSSRIKGRHTDHHVQGRVRFRQSWGMRQRCGQALRSHRLDVSDKQHGQHTPGWAHVDRRRSVECWASLDPDVVWGPH